jgi:hypothetical protein
MCSHDLSVESILNVSKAIALSSKLLYACLNRYNNLMLKSKGMWITFLEIDELSNTNKSILSNVLTQLNSNNESITINKESFKNAHQKEVPYFAIISNDAKIKQEFKDTLKILTQGNLFQNVSKDLLKKFRIISTKSIDHKKQLALNLLTCGFKNYNVLGDFLSELVYLYNKLRKIGSNFTHVSNASAENLENIVKNAGIAVKNELTSRSCPKKGQNITGRKLIFV